VSVFLSENDLILVEFGTLNQLMTITTQFDKSTFFAAVFQKSKMAPFLFEQLLSQMLTDFKDIW